MARSNFMAKGNLKIGCILLAIVVISVSLIGCGDDIKPVAPHKLTQKEKIAQNYEAQKEAVKKAKYAKAFSHFQNYVLTLPAVRGTQQFGDDGFRVYILGNASDYEVRKIGQGLYDRFVVIRKPYMSEDKAENCVIFVYDDTGRELGTTNEWNR